MKYNISIYVNYDEIFCILVREDDMCIAWCFSSKFFYKNYYNPLKHLGNILKNPFYTHNTEEEDVILKWAKDKDECSFVSLHLNVEFEEIIPTLQLYI